MSIRDKFKATSTAVLKETVDKENASLNSGRGSDFLDIEDGLNKFRIFPKHEGEEKFTHIYGRHWLTVEKDGENKRTTVPNSKVHAGTDMDIIDEYIKFCQLTLDANDSDEAAKLKSLVTFPNGINMQTTWLAYAKYMPKNGKEVFGILELKKTVRDAMNELAIIEDESEAMELDPFTDPDDGLPVLITYNSKAKKAKDYYKVQLSKNKSPLTDEELEAFAKLQPLSKLGMLQYGMDQFETALEGIRIFDEEHEINLFDSDGFQSVIEEVKSQYDASVGGDKKETTKKSSAKPDVKKSVKRPAEVEEEAEEDEDEAPFETEEEAEEESGDEYDAMERPDLIKALRALDSEVKIFKSTEDDTLRDMIRERAGSSDETEEEAEEEAEEEEAPAKPATTTGKSKLSLNDIKAKLKK